ncbi:MFS transporter [Myroides odoratus]|uniref:MFS transporter n=1 Tax=Myroides odoratus TaxID=256 RepID=UPI0039B10CE1
MNTTIAPFKKRVTLVLLSMSIFLSVLDLFIVNVAIPQIREALNANVADIQFIIVYYVIGYGAFLITSGKVGLKYGHKRVFILSIFSFGLFSFLCGIASTVEQLNLFRLLQGMSGAFMVPQGVTLLATVFTEEQERRRAYAIYGAIAGIASVLGQVLGGFLPDLAYDFGAWRLIFLINVPLAFLVGLLSCFLLVEVERKKTIQIQPLSQLTLIALLVLFLYSLVRGVDAGWTTFLLLGFVFSVLGILMFFYFQFKKYKQNKSVLIDFKPFKNSAFKVTLLALVFYSFVQDSYFFIYANHFQLQLHYTATETGLLFAFQGIGYVLASLLSFKFLAQYQERFMLLGLLLMVVGLITHYLLLRTEQLTFYQVSLLLFEYGVGCGIILPSMFTYALSTLPTAYTSAGSSLYLTVQQLSIALGVSLVGQTYFSSTNGFLYATILMLILLILTGSVFLLSYQRRLTAFMQN